MATCNEAEGVGAICPESGRRRTRKQNVTNDFRLTDDTWPRKWIICLEFCWAHVFLVSNNTGATRIEYGSGFLCLLFLRKAASDHKMVSNVRPKWRRITWPLMKSTQHGVFPCRLMYVIRTWTSLKQRTFGSSTYVITLNHVSCTCTSTCFRYWDVSFNRPGSPKPDVTG